MYRPGHHPAWMNKRTSEKTSDGGTWSKFGPLIVDKLLLAVIAAALIAVFQNRLQISQERIEKARHVADILIDKPISIVAQLPEHLDAFILYAEHIHSHDVEISSQQLTELQAKISSDIEGSRAYHDEDRDLKTWAAAIKATITAVRAKALVRKSLGTDDIRTLEDARALAYRFHHRVIQLSVRQALD